VPAYADTSFLFALVLRDANSVAAGAYLSTHREALPLSPWQHCELRNAIRLAQFRKHTSASLAQTALNQIASDLVSGDFVETPLDWPAVLEEAERLSATHTATIGVRTLDLLHIGAAKSLGLNVFLSFDDRQRACAKAAGLRVRPEA